MKTYIAATVAAIANATHQYDVSGYESNFFGDHAQDPVYASTINYGPPADPYVDDGHHGHAGHAHFADQEPSYRPNETVYKHEPRHVEHVRREVHEYAEEQYPVHDPYTDQHYGTVPLGDFWNQVSDFDAWDEIWDQHEYEERIQTEAEMMVSLEAIREALVDLDYNIDYLEDCVDENQNDIDRNHYGINDNDDAIDYNDRAIDDQRYQLKRLQKQCRYCDARLWEDRDFLVLYCQQFAYAKDMVGACADILTCRGTQVPFRWVVGHVQAGQASYH